MTLSQIRRSLLILLGILLAITGILLVIVNKHDPANLDADAIVDVVAFTPELNKAPVAKEALENLGLKVSMMKVEHAIAVPNGYRLLLRHDNPNFLESVRQSLKVKKLESRLVDNKSALQYGGIFKTEKEAQKKSEAVQKQSGGVAFAVEVNMKQVTKPCMKAIVSAAPKTKALEIKGILEEATFVDVTIKDVTPAAK